MRKINNTIPRSYLCNGSGAAAADANWGGVRPMNRPVNGGGVSQSLVQNPSTTILVMENGYQRNEPEAWTTGDFNTTTAGNAIRFTNHLSTTNFLFTDGHVKALKATATPLNMWNVANTTVAGDAAAGPGGTALRDMLAQQQATYLP